jgi:ABC-type transport system involved in multi-copper enzyme maturation permease subunit
VKSIWIITKMTFREAIRKRIVLTGLALGICFLTVFSLGFHMIFTEVTREGTEAVKAGRGSQLMNNVADREGTNMLLLAGLYAVTFLSIAMGALLGADTLSGEINSGTIQTIVTKPIRRSDVVLGKWLGYAWLLGLYFLLMGGGTIASVFIQAGYVPDHLLAGLGLIYMETLLVMTVSLMCSSVLSALATGGTVFGLYGLAFIGGWIEQIGAALHNPTAIKVGIITSLIIPSESLWRRAAFEMQSPIAGVMGISPFGTTSVPSGLMVAYAGLYLLVALALGIRFFQKRDL